MQLQLHARCALCIEAGLAQDRTTTFLNRTGLERNLALRAALATNGIVHLAVLHALALARIAAILATLGSAQVLAGVKLLFSFGKGEGLPAVAAL